MRLVLVRHGETEHNRSKLTLGRADVPLTALGGRQARAIAASITRPPDAIVSSPLRRALDVAAAIGLATGVTPEVMPALIEMDVGEMEHLTGAQLLERHPAFLAEWRGAGAAAARMPGGETLGEVQERAWSAVEALYARVPRGTVIAVSHNFVILTLVCRALGLPLSEFRRIRQNVGALSILEVQDQRAAVLRLNDTSHLAAAGLLD